MTLSRIEDCNEEILRIRLHMLGIDGIYGKGECVKKLKELQVLLVDKKLTNKHKNDIKHVDFSRSKTFRGTPTNKTRDFTLKPEPVTDSSSSKMEYRKYIPVSSANDSLVSNQLVLGSLDVYHNITYGPYKMNMGNKVYELEYEINQLKAHTEIQTIDPNLYTPVVNFTNVSDSANIESVTAGVNVLDKVIDLNIQMKFNEIKLKGATFSITLPYELDTEYYKFNEYINGELMVHYDKVGNTDVFRHDSSLSHVFIRKNSPNLLSIDSSLLICLSDHKNFFIDKPDFKMDIHISYHASNIDVHDNIHAMLSNIDDMNSNIGNLWATIPI
jgi:hypothetical protein